MTLFPSETKTIEDDEEPEEVTMADGVGQRMSGSGHGGEAGNG